MLREKQGSKNSRITRQGKAEALWQLKDRSFSQIKKRAGGRLWGKMLPGFVPSRSYFHTFDEEPSKVATRPQIKMNLLTSMANKVTTTGMAQLVG